jgi:glycosyltransferase involved in cell wall biosynthesis
LFTHYICVSERAFPFCARKPIVEKVQCGECIELLQVGRFVEKKGHEYTIKALASLKKIFSNWRMSFVGDGPLLSKCQELAKDLGLDKQILFLGPLPPSRIAALMAQADAFLHHSVTATNGDQEGIPISIMEAMASGLPVISTMHSGIPELVENEVTGFLVPERNLERYTSALERLLECGTEVGIKARSRVEVHFNLDIQNAVLRQIYGRLSGVRHDWRLGDNQVVQGEAKRDTPLTLPRINRVGFLMAPQAAAWATHGISPL